MPTIDELRAEAAQPVVIADQWGIILQVNDAFAAFTGWKPAEIVGKPLTTIIPRRLHDAHNLGFSRFLATGAPPVLGRPIKLNVMKSDGAELDSEHYIVAERQDGRWVFGAILRPVEAAPSQDP